MKLRVLSMFAGIGAIDLGLQRAGMEIAAQCEIDPYACAVLLERFPGVPNLGDVTSADFASVDADVIAAGFPCQDLSNAGKRAGLAGTRSGLFWQVDRAVRVVRPTVVVLENVAALHNRGLGEVLGALAALGYDATVHCIPASHVGAPHDRDRTWIVAHAIGCEWRQEPYDRALGRMGRKQQSVPWDRDWQSALRQLRGVDDGTAYRVERVDTLRNAVVPQVVEHIGRAILAALNEPAPAPCGAQTAGGNVSQPSPALSFPAPLISMPSEAVPYTHSQGGAHLTAPKDQCPRPIGAVPYSLACAPPVGTHVEAGDTCASGLDCGGGSVAVSAPDHPGVVRPFHAEGYN